MTKRYVTWYYRIRWFFLSGFIIVSLTSLPFTEEQVSAEIATNIKSLGDKNTSRSVQPQTLITNTTYLPFVANTQPLLPFGVQVYSSIGPGTPALQSAIDVNTTWIRRPISWADIEPTDTTPENFNWTSTDVMFLAAWSNNKKVLATIGFNPSWAAPHGGAPVYPAFENDWLEFVGALVERYDRDGFNDAPGSPMVEHWEFYNEPDNTNPLASDGFGLWGFQGADYATMLGKTQSVVKAANPNAQILFGGVAHDSFTFEVPFGGFDQGVLLMIFWQRVVETILTYSIFIIIPYGEPDGLVTVMI